MVDVLVLTNREPDFFQKFSRCVFGDVESEYDVSYVDRKGSVLETTIRFLLMLIRSRPDLIWVAGSGFATFWTCFFGRLLPGTRVVFYHNDFTYQHMRDFKDIPWWRLQIERIQEMGPLLFCDIVGTMTEYHESYLNQKGIDKPFFKIPHGVDTSEFRPDGRQKREELGIDNQLVVGVMGTFNRSEVHNIMYGWTLIEALAHLKNTPVIGLFIGGGEDLEYLRSRAEELGISDSVILTGRVPHVEIPEYLSTIDVSLLIKPDHPADKMTTTMKLPEYLAAGNYIIADDHAFAATVLDPQRASLLSYEGIKDESFPERLADEIQTLASDPTRLEAGKKHSREVAVSQFQYDDIREHVLKEVSAIIDGKTSSE